jgi:hypothetical protein
MNSEQMLCPCQYLPPVTQVVALNGVSSIHFCLSPYCAHAHTCMQFVLQVFLPKLDTVNAKWGSQICVCVPANMFHVQNYLSDFLHMWYWGSVLKVVE